MLEAEVGKVKDLPLTSELEKRNGRETSLNLHVLPKLQRSLQKREFLVVEENVCALDKINLSYDTTQ